MSRATSTAASVAPVPGEGFGDRYWRRAELLASTFDGLRPDQTDQPIFRDLADNLPTLCWIADADGYISWYNRRWHEYCGTTPQEMEGWGWRSVHDPAVLPAVLDRWTGSIASGEPFEMVFPLRGADGCFRPFLTRIVPLRDAGGAIRRWVGINVDISAQVAAEEELRRSQEALQETNRRLAEREAFLSSVLGSSTDCIKVLDLTGRLVFMSEGGQRVMEVSDFNAIAGCPWPDFWAGAGNAAATAAIAAAAAGEARSFIGRAETMAGTPRWWHVAVSPIPGPDGRPERILSVSRDITELRASEEQRDRFVRLVENSQDFIGMAHHDGRVFFVNAAGRRLVGLDDADVAALSIADFLMPDEVARVAAEILPSVDRDGHWAGELGFRHFRTGERMPMLYSVFPITDAAGEISGYGTVTRDFREQKRAEEQQQLLSGELAHRIKNMFGVVQAIAFQTLGPGDNRAEVQNFNARLKALAAAQDVLTREDWAAARIDKVAEGVLATFGDAERIALDGPELTVGPRAGLALSLLLHELATNATKHGALSVPAGHIRLCWSLSGDHGQEIVRVEWIERGGPPAAEPTRRGFGSRIIRLGLTGSGGVELCYAPAGLSATMVAPLAQLQQA